MKKIYRKQISSLEQGDLLYVTGNNNDFKCLHLVSFLFWHYLLFQRGCAKIVQAVFLQRKEQVKDEFM